MPTAPPPEATEYYLHSARAYRPDRIVLVRHGESEGNVDERIYETTPDHALALTEAGRQQARAAGRRVDALVRGSTVRLWVSPYLRTRQTAALLAEECAALNAASAATVVEPRLREQDWANFQNPDDIHRQKEERDRFGHFFYRFDRGESGADVYDRVTGFLDAMHRDFLPPRTHESSVIVTHGLTMRLFCMGWFHWSVEYFESLKNPGNGEVFELLKQPDGGYRMARPFEQWDAAYTPTAAERASWL